MSALLTFLTFYLCRGRARPKTTRERNVTTLLYLISAAIATAGASYAAVPLYRVFCQTTNYGGTISQGHDAEKVETMKKSEERLLTIKFNADTAAQMRRVSKYFSKIFLQNKFF